MIPTSAQLELLQTRPHSTRLWLSIYKPDVIFAAQVDDGSATKGLMSFAYHNLVSGSAGYVESGMTCYVGTTPQGHEKGKIRVRGITGSILYLAENDYINWANNDYLTIVRYVEPWTVYPRITSGTSSYIKMYKDWDIEYTNQNNALGSFINMGCNHACFRENGTGTVYYSASGTYNLRGDALSYEWFFQGATVTGSSLHTPGYITYNTPGHYVTRLTVTSSGSAGIISDVSYRHVSIYDRPENGTKTPILRWKMDGIDGSRDQGGYSTRITIFDDVNENNVVDGALVVIFADDYYGNTKQSIGGNALNRDSIVFCGYILDGSIEYNWGSKSVSFEVGSPTERLKTIPGMSMYVLSSADPNNEPNVNEDIPSAWAALLDMDCRRAMYYYLRWHSTALMTNDFEFVGTDQRIKYFDPDSASIYDIIDSFLNDTLCGKLVCDRQGKFWAEVETKAIDNATGTLPVHYLLQKNDWLNSISIEEVNRDELYYLEMGGFVFDGTTSTPYLACAPGNNLNYEGEADSQEGLALLSQDQLNVLVGNVFAHRNSRYPSIDINLAGNYRIFDIAPQEQIPISTIATDNNRGIVWSNKNFHPISMSLSFDGKNEALLSSVNMHEVTQGFPGDTIIIPPEPPDDGDYIPDYPIPDIPPVPLPTGTIVPPVYHDDHPDTVFVVGAKYLGTGSSAIDNDVNHYMLTLAKTTDFNSTSPTWTEMLPSNVSGTAGQLTYFDVSFHATYPEAMCWWLTQYGVWEIGGLHTASPFAANLLDVNDVITLISPLAGYTPTGIRFIRILASPIDDFLSTVYVLVEPTDTPNTWYPAFLLKCNRYAGNTWSVLGILYSGAGAAYRRIADKGAGVALSPTNKNSMFASAGGDALHYTLDEGGFWYNIFDGNSFYAPCDAHIIKAAPNNVYFVAGPSAPIGHIYHSPSYGASGTFSDVTPNISGSYWGNYNGSPFREIMITSSNIDTTKINAILMNTPGTGLFTSDNNGTTWNYVTWLGGKHAGDNGKVRGLITHPYDINKLYLSMYPECGTEIAASSDRGKTWVSKTGNWSTVFGCSPTRTINCNVVSCGGYIFPVFKW